jgi:hypothetical protein
MSGRIAATLLVAFAATSAVANHSSGGHSSGGHSSARQGSGGHAWSGHTFSSGLSDAERRHPRPGYGSGARLYGHR